MSKAKVLIIVHGGCADWKSEGDVEVDTFDLDNWECMNSEERKEVRDSFDANPEWKKFLPAWIRAHIWEGQ